MIDHKEKIENLYYIKQYSNIKFNFYINTENHPWRNPAVPINYGIKQAKGKYIMIISPESIFVNDVVDKLYLKCIKKENIFAYGNIIFTHESYYNNNDITNLFNTRVKVTVNYTGPIGYGSICCATTNFKKVGCYNEDYILWGGEDDNIREKLKKNGVKGRHVTMAKMVHLETLKELFKRQKKLQNKENIKNVFEIYSYSQIKKILNTNNIELPQHITNIVDSEENINENLYNEKKVKILIYEYLYELYKKKKLSKLIINDLNKYNNFTIEPSISQNIRKFYNSTQKLEKLILNSNDSFEKCEFGHKFKIDYKIMLLTPCYNEEEHIINFLENNKELVDGCIILDDGSSDKTWEYITPNYFSIKVKKNEIDYGMI